MNVNGLWTAYFSTASGQGSGVLTLANGWLSGGDSNYFYLGQYVLAKNIITGNLAVKHFAGVPNSVFGPISNPSLNFTAVAAENLILAQGHLIGPSPQLLSIKLHRVSMLGG